MVEYRGNTYQVGNATPNAAQKMRESLVGLTIVEAGKCDFCPSETTDCKKLILADGSHICVKDMSKQPSKA